MEHVIARRELHIERKYLVIELRENERGRFLKICETAAGRRNLVIVPETGLAEFTRALASVLEPKAQAGLADGEIEGKVQDDYLSRDVSPTAGGEIKSSPDGQNGMEC